SLLAEAAAYADGILPASAWPEKDGTVTNTNRQVQMGRRALPLPGEAKVDWWITQEIARRLGLNWNYRHPSEIYTEMASLMPALDNISWDRIERESAVTYPSDAPDKPGHDVVIVDRFPTPHRRAVWRQVPLRGRPRHARAGEDSAAGRAARRRISVRAMDRPPARALASRRHDAARLDARRARAGRRRQSLARHHRQARHQA